MSTQTSITRIRVRYTKGESLRFTGHLDLQRLWERLLRRSGLPIRYSQGYHPRARLNLASALPLGFVSDDEQLDFWMDEPREMEDVLACLRRSAPPGLEIQSARAVDLSEDALQVRMKASEFVVSFYDPQDRGVLMRKVNTLLAKEEIRHARRKKVYDLRPLILNLEVTAGPSGGVGLWMRLLAEPGATGRPDDLLDELRFANTDYLVRRTQLIFTDGQG